MDRERQPLLGSQQPRSTTLSPRQTQLACAAILLTEMLERIAFYGIVGNLVMFLNGKPFEWSMLNASNALFIFTAMSYMTALFGGWLADNFLGKFPTLVLFFVIYIGGYVFMPLLFPYPSMPSDPAAPSWCAGVNASSTPPTITPPMSPVPWYNITTNPSVGDEVCSWSVFLALGIMGLGTGAVKANIAPFGADQIKHEGFGMMRAFFNWYYWCVNAGALIALGALAYVQQEISFFWGYVAPCIALCVALLVFITGCRWYVRSPVRGSVITNIVKILCESCRRCRLNASKKNDSLLSSDSIIDRLENTTPGCLDLAKVRYGGSFHDSAVDDVRKLGKIFLVFLALVPYWLVYFQMQTTYQIQGMHMRLDFVANDSKKANCDSGQFNIPSAWLSLFDVIFLIVLLPVMDRVIYPKLDASGHYLSLRTRILIGMAFAVLSICTAGGLEMIRLRIYWRDGAENIHWQCIGKTTYRAADISILWQVPQYALIGISEVFASVAGLELAYSYAPRSMQGIIMGLFWFTQGIGSLLGTASIEWFRGVWFFNWDHGDINCRIHCPNDPNKICSCHLDYYFFVLAGIQVLGMLIFGLLVWFLDIGHAHPPRRAQNGHLNPSSTSSSGRNSAASMQNAAEGALDSNGHMRAQSSPEIT